MNGDTKEGRGDDHTLYSYIVKGDAEAGWYKRVLALSKLVSDHYKEHHLCLHIKWQ